MSIQEMVRTMLNENTLPKYFWAEAINTTCYILNRVLKAQKMLWLIISLVAILTQL